MKEQVGEARLSNRYSSRPANWAIANLGDVVESDRPITYGIVKAGEYLSTGVFMVRSQDYSTGWSSPETIVKVSKEVDSPYERSRIRKGDILVTLVGAGLGNTAMVPDWLHGANISRASGRISINPKKADNYFVYYYIGSGALQKIIQETQIGGAQPVLNLAALVEIQITLPPLAEQRRIATLIKAWDRAISLTTQLIAQKELRKKWLMQQLLSEGKNRRGIFSSDWRPISFGEIYRPKMEIAGNNFYELLSVTRNGIVAQSTYFKKSIASDDTSKYLVVKRGDLVMSGLNFWMGAIDVIRDFESGMVSPAYKVFSIQSKIVNPVYMHFFVKGQQMLRALVGSSVQGASIVRRNLDMEMLSAWSFRIPGHSDQQKIGRLLALVTREIEIFRQELRRLDVQKRGIMQVLLTGKIRLNKRK